MRNIDWKKEIFTIPNLLSLFRLALIPVYMIIYLNADEPADYFVAAAVLMVSCLTDLIDGKIARHFNMISTVGKLLDPVADKATQFTLIVTFAIEHPVLWYLAGFFVIKEGFMLIAGGLAWRKGKMLEGALLPGKICTTILFLSLIFMILYPDMTDKQVLLVMIVDAAFMLFAFGAYILAYFGKNKKIYDIPQSN